jgi:hypothetical protein
MIRRRATSVLGFASSHGERIDDDDVQGDDDDGRDRVGGDEESMFTIALTPGGALRRSADGGRRELPVRLGAAPPGVIACYG